MPFLNLSKRYTASGINSHQGKYLKGVERSEMSFKKLRIDCGKVVTYCKVEIVGKELHSDCGKI